MPFTIPNTLDAEDETQAAPDSVDFDILVAAYDGYGVVSGCAVTPQGSPNMTVAVAAGVIAADWTLASVTGGNVTITAADGTNPRFDLIVVDDTGAKSAVAGTPAPAPSPTEVGPEFPAIPANSVVLAAVRVPASDTTISTGQITDKRVIIRSLSSGISGGDTLNGGDAASETLTLGSTSHATRGVINLRDRTLLVTEDQSSGAAAPVVLMSVAAARTITLDETDYNAGNVATGWSYAPTILYVGNAPIAVSGVFSDTSTLKNSGARTNLSPATFVSNPTIIGDAALHTISHVGLSRSPTVSISSAGTTAAILTDISSAAAVNTGATVSQRIGFSFADATGAGTVTTQVAVDIPALAKGATNIGIRNASTEVATPLANTAITAVSGTIRIDASTVTLTANASYTLTSTPTIADGQTGQRLRVINVDTTDSITLQDESVLASTNLDLWTGQVRLGPGESITLEYNGTSGLWQQVAGLYRSLPVSKTTTYQILPEDVVLADATSGTFTATLPAHAAGRRATVKKVDTTANAVTVARSGGTGNIDGAAASLSITIPYTSYDLISDGTNWWIL